MGNHSPLTHQRLHDVDDAVGRKVLQRNDLGKVTFLLRKIVPHADSGRLLLGSRYWNDLIDISGFDGGEIVSLQDRLDDRKGLGHRNLLDPHGHLGLDALS